MGSVRTDNVQIKLDIDASQSKTELDNLTRRSQVLKTDLKEMKRGTEEYIAANKELRQVSARVEELHKELGTAGLSMNQLQNRSRQLNRELKDLTPGTEAFISKSKQLGEVDARLHQVRDEVRGIADELKSTGGGFGDFVKKSAAFVGIQIGVQEAVSAIKQLGSESIDAAAKGSDSIADMEKSLNVTTAQAKALREELGGIDTRTTQEELEGIAIAGGQLGVAAEDVDEFTVAVDQAVVALGDEFTGGVDDVTKSIGGLQKLFKETKDQKPDEAITKIGSALNALGADGSATSPVIAEFTARIGQLGDLAPEITQTLGLGAAFHELGLSAEISSGGVTNVLLTASKETAKFAAQLGLTDKEFKNLLNSDPNEVLLRLAESLKGASNTEIVGTLDRLGIKSQEATKVVSLLANQTDIVRQKQALAGQEFEKGTSLLEEFTKKNTNAAAQIDKAEKGFARYRQELGERLIPIYIKSLQFLGLLIEGFKAAPEFINENRALFIGLGLAILTLNLANIKATASTLVQLAAEKGRAVATRASAAAQYLLNAAMTANPIGLVVAAVALLVGGLITLYERSERVRETFAGLANVARVVFGDFKKIALETLGGIGNLLAGIFTFNPALISAGIAQLRETGSKASAAYHEGFEAQEAKEQAKSQKKSEERTELKKKTEEAATKRRVEAAAAADKAASADRLRQQQAALELQLSKTKEGSEQELKLKKQLVLVARDIELQDEKKTTGERAVIRSKAQVELNKLNQDYAKKQEAERKKAAEELKKQQEEEDQAEAANRKRRADLEVDAYKRKEAELRAAAATEGEKLKGTAAQIAEGRKLIDEKLTRDLVELERDRVAKQTAIMREIEQADEDIASRRRARARRKNGEDDGPDAVDAEVERARRLAEARQRLAEDLASAEFQAEPGDVDYLDKMNMRLDLIRQEKNIEVEINQEAADRIDQLKIEKAASDVARSGELINTLGSFLKLASDAEITRAETTKTKRLKTLDSEYKQGKLSKEEYEKQKVQIETQSDSQIRAAKKKGAEQDKALAVAQSIIQGTLAVLATAAKSGFLSPATILAGIAAAAATVKIVATPIPTFEKGGIIGQAYRSAKRFAQGGRMNPRGGVADVGQLHNGGGIQMTDGATGEHLGEWERGEAYMILSRETTKNNGDLINELLDTSLYRGGARVRPRGGVYAEDGAVVGGPRRAASPAPAGDQGAVVQAIDRQTAVLADALAQPVPAVVDWGQDDDAQLEQRLDERQRVRRQTEG